MLTQGWSVILILLTVWRAAPAATVSEMPRLIVLTDIGGDPDDTQSMIRLLVYSNGFEIEGLIASASGTPGELGVNLVKPQLIRELVDAYGMVRPNLLLHDHGFPTVDHLRARIKVGNPNRGIENIGEGQDTEGSNWIVSAAGRDDPRPLNIAIWGGSTELAQALWRVRRDRPAAEVASFVKRLRIYAIGHQDNTGPWIIGNFPDLFYILAKSAERSDKRESAYRGMYLGGEESLTSLEWISENVLAGHGPLGSLYPLKTWTAPNPHGVLKEGDTPSWFFFLPNGLGDPAHPEWGGWGGRFRPAYGGLYRDDADRIGGAGDARISVSRWRAAYQNDFAARMDWCVKPFAEANHNPIAVGMGEQGRGVITLDAAPGAELRLNAEGSSDPDGNELNYRWYVYREAGTYRGDVAVRHSNRQRANLIVPVESIGKTIHVILEVIDSGKPRLTSFRRLIIHVTAS
jgi:hypothetical protein